MKNKIFAKLDQAAGKALDYQNKVFGFQADPDLARYEQLQDVDFETIARTYGQEALTQYVETMESRRLRGA